MKVHRRGASSPSLLLEASEPPTSVNVNGNYYQFELEPHHVEKGKRGQKLFVCDLCPAPNGIFKRSFSLKRHYLRFHINFAFLSPRDLNNCAIAVASQHQRSGYPASGVNNGLINRLSGSSPLLYRCHQCGCLLRTKNDLLKHLETHPGPSTNEAEKLVNNGDHRGTNRCPRCSTAFSLRKTLMRHIKKNRCRGGGPPLAGPPPKTESETGVQSGETSDQCDESDLAARDEESEEMDMEASLRLGCPSSLFRFACTLCTKMFNSYVNMCRHRRLAHGRYGICSPHWLLSRKLSGKSMLHHSVPSPVISMTQNLQNSQDLSHFVQNANDNLTQFIDGKIVHIRSTVPADARFDVPDVGVPPPDRWSWKETNYNFHELQRLDVPLQLAYYRGLQLWKIQEAAKTEDSSSQAETEETVSIPSALNLRPVESIPPANVDMTVPTPEFSGEWVRSKSYICAPCGQLFHDFLVLLDHQQAIHNGIVCTHIQLDKSSEVGLAEELIRQIRRSGSGGSTHLTTALQCTKCHFSVQSIAELHSHILLCSNHVSASPSRKRRFKVNPSSRRSHWSQNRGMQRTISSQTKNSSAPRSLRSRSPREEVAEDDASGNILRRSARRVLSFNEKPPSKKKKKNVTVSKRVLRQRPDTPRVNGTATPKTVQNEGTKKKSTPAANTKSSTKVVVDVYECDGCQKAFQSRTSVLKHKHYCPNKQNESVIDAPSRTPTPSTPPKPVKVSVNGQSKIKSKPSTPSSGNAQGKLEQSSSKKQQLAAKNVSSSPKTKSKTPVPRTNGIHLTPKVSDTHKKLAKSKKTLAVTPTTSPVKTSSKSKSRLKHVPTKSKRKSSKSVMEEEDEETVELEEITLTPGRPIRSSRKASMTLVMEDQVEASFLEALSPEQRIRVAEQRCPFCSKHYVYRSNFKKHLLEGCDTADADELSVISTPTLKKPVIVVEDKRVNVKKTAVSPVSKVEKKVTREKSDNKSKKIENSNKKEADGKGKEKAVKKVPKKKSEKTPKQITKPLPLKPEETKKTTKTQRKATKVNQVASVKLARKKVTGKKVVDTGKNKVKRKNKVTQAAHIEESDNENKITEEEAAKMEEDSDASMVEASSTKNESVVEDIEDPAESNGVSHIRAEKTSNDAVGKESPITETCEENGIVDDTVKENGISGTSAKVKTSTTGCIYKDSELDLDFSKCSNGRSPVAHNEEHNRLDSLTSSEQDSNEVQSHALDKHRLGEALNDALKSGIFQCYAGLTQYPVRMRRLKTMAQAYTAN